MTTGKRDDLRFEDLVGQVTPLESSPRRVPPQRETAASARVRERPALGAMVVECEDEQVSGRSVGVPLHCLEELRRGRPSPGRELDLHRMSAAKASGALTVALRQARADRIQSLLIICGRGNHSGRGGPVLPSLVVEVLSGALSDGVLAFCTAPRQFGGRGAIIVRLRGPV